jgi:hypothetical protein
VEGEILVESFTEKEMKKAVFQMEHNKSSGLMAIRLNLTKYSGM